MRTRDQVGELRPSQLLHTYGVGATVELPELTTLVLGLDEWPRVLGEPISEPRLLAALRSFVGPQLEQLLTPPVVADGELGGVPVAPFPRWLRCPLCSLLSPVETGIFELDVNRWRPDRTSYVHRGCPKSRSRRPPTAFPARFLMTCQAGHLDDFPWFAFLHGGLPCPGTLRLREFGSGGRPADLEVSCDECGRRRRLSQAFGEDAAPFLPPRCRGRHPHLGTTQPCEQEPKTLLLGASNAWFAVQASALSIPSREGELADAIDEASTALEHAPTDAGGFTYVLANVPALQRLRELAAVMGEQVVREAVMGRRDELRDDADERRDLRTPEWRVFTSPHDAPETADFRLRVVAVPPSFAGDLTEIVLAERLREVSALRGFTRLAAPDDIAATGGTIAPLSREAPRWLPCTEVRGEGIFLRFEEERILAWEQSYREAGAAERMRTAHGAWRARRGLDPDDGWPGERYVLLHSFAHALMRELALECGYTASSIRERIYADDGRDGGEVMAGVLLYTSAPDSEGTLGGLVALGEPEQLGPLLRQTFERAQLCSSDPLCSEHDPRSDGSVHAAACHACQFASETSCERGNRFLDRAALVPSLATHEAPVAYFQAT